jgi:hypothetical protein
MFECLLSSRNFLSIPKTMFFLYHVRILTVKKQPGNKQNIGCYCNENIERLFRTFLDLYTKYACYDYSLKRDNIRI